MGEREVRLAQDLRDFVDAEVRVDDAGVSADRVQECGECFVETSGARQPAAAFGEGGGLHPFSGSATRAPIRTVPPHALPEIRPRVASYSGQAR